MNTDVPVPLLQSDGHGWQVVDLAEWLFQQSAGDWRLIELIDRVGNRLVAMGAPVTRMRISFRTLHPQVRARSGLWVRGRPVEMLRVSNETQESEVYIGSPIQTVLETSRSVRRRLDDLDPETDHQVLFEMRADGGRDYLAIPTLFDGAPGGVATFVSDDPAGFSESDITKLHGVVQVLSPFLRVIAMRDTGRSLLNTYLGPRTGERVLSGRIHRGDGEVIQAAMWFSDLRDFTALTESLPPERMLGMLNAYFELVAAAVTAQEGEILRFIGDAMLIVFPVTATTPAPMACRAALDAALDAFASLAALNHRRRRVGEPQIRFGVGLHVGEVIYGNVGAPERLDFTVQGPAVNRTARLEGLTKDLDSPVLMSAEFAGCVEEPTRSLGSHAMKGVAEPVEVFALQDPP